MGIQTHFNKFHDKIKLRREDDNYRKARERDDSITAQVKSAFTEAGYPVTENFIQGSLKTHTGIVPISGDYDIDRALVIRAADAPEDPVEPKMLILRVLEQRGFKNSRIKKPCVTADYASEKVHIDFVVYRESDGTYDLAVGKKYSSHRHRRWSLSDPHGLIDWINQPIQNPCAEPDQTRRQFYRIVRYLKRWRDEQFNDVVAKKIFSIGLTIMVKQQFSPSFSTEGARQDLTAMVQTTEKILTAGYFIKDSEGRHHVHAPLPVSPSRDVFHGSSLATGTQFHNKLKLLLKGLESADSTSNIRKQCVMLNKLFGRDFSVPSLRKSHSDANRSKYASAGIVRHSQGA